MRLTVLLPSLNEAEGITRTLRRIPLSDLRDAQWQPDILVVDGESTDGTAERARTLGARVIVESLRGYGRAYKTGFDAAQGDVVVTGDADDTYPLDGLVGYLAEFTRRRLDFATLNRFASMTPGSMRVKHRFGNGVLNLAVRTLYGVRIEDSQSGMWILNRRALDRIPYASLSDGMPFSQELKLAAFRHPDLRAAELPGRYYHRVGDPKLSSWRDGTRNLAALVRRRFGSSSLGKAVVKKPRP